MRLFNRKIPKHKSRYPESINGIKQEQNRFKRLFILVWHSDVFRLLNLIPFYPVTAVIVFALTDWDISSDIRQAICVTPYLLMLTLLLVYNDAEEFYRIGRDIDGKKIKEIDNESV